MGVLVERIRYTDHVLDFEFELDFAFVVLDRGDDDDEDGGCCGDGGGFDDDALRFGGFTDRNVLDSNLVIWSREMASVDHVPPAMFRKRSACLVFLFRPKLLKV
ncbi:unnamed protein product [Dovyalis caffra]|uniref:Uncharacterized protein n=1 Tax=Dovyalis caffra TaxID=77055 RepID=A0AAV1R912_9ROSI|nr:unnamed protein product [Dovyalis caffra]